jgi:hypothetical protein
LLARVLTDGLRIERSPDGVEIDKIILDVEARKGRSSIGGAPIGGGASWRPAGFARNMIMLVTCGRRMGS